MPGNIPLDLKDSHPEPENIHSAAEHSLENRSLVRSLSEIHSLENCSERIHFGFGVASLGIPFALAKIHFGDQMPENPLGPEKIHFEDPQASHPVPENPLEPEKIRFVDHVPETLLGPEKTQLADRLGGKPK